jgi:hypothetical protein
MIRNKEKVVKKTLALFSCHRIWVSLSDESCTRFLTSVVTAGKVPAALTVVLQVTADQEHASGVVYETGQLVIT